MWRTRVGYAGGSTPFPTYKRIGDHTEVFQVDFDPASVTYEELLDAFFMAHNAAGVSLSRQYRSVILCSDDTQRAKANAVKARYERLTDLRMQTSIEPLARFFLAEEYHQKYGLRADRLLAQEFTAMYPDPSDLRESTAAARVNGYVYAGGPADLFRRESGEYGLSDAARQRLGDRLSRYGGALL